LNRERVGIKQNREGGKKGGKKGGAVQEKGGGGEHVRKTLNEHVQGDQ